MGQNIDAFMWIVNQALNFWPSWYNTGPSRQPLYTPNHRTKADLCFLYVKFWTSPCSLASCCLYQDYFTFVEQPKLRPDAKVVQRDPQCSIAPVALCCKRLHIVQTARKKNIVYKRSLQAAPSNQFTSLYSTILYPSSAVALTRWSVLMGWNTLLHI